MNEPSDPITPTLGAYHDILILHVPTLSQYLPDILGFPLLVFTQIVTHVL